MNIPKKNPTRFRWIAHHFATFEKQMFARVLVIESKDRTEKKSVASKYEIEMKIHRGYIHAIATGHLDVSYKYSSVNWNSHALHHIHKDIVRSGAHFLLFKNSISPYLWNESDRERERAQAHSIRRSNMNMTYLVIRHLCNIFHVWEHICAWIRKTLWNIQFRETEPTSDLSCFFEWNVRQIHCNNLCVCVCVLRVCRSTESRLTR